MLVPFDYNMFSIEKSPAAGAVNVPGRAQFKHDAWFVASRNEQCPCHAVYKPSGAGWRGFRQIRVLTIWCLKIRFGYSERAEARGDAAVTAGITRAQLLIPGTSRRIRRNQVFR